MAGPSSASGVGVAEVDVVLHDDLERHVLWWGGSVFSGAALGARSSDSCCELGQMKPPLRVI